MNTIKLHFIFKKLILFILLIICSKAIQAEAKSGFYKDSLHAQELSNRAWKLKNSYPDSSFLLAKEALQIAQKINLKKLEAYSLSDIGNYYKRKEKYPEAQQYLEMSLEVRHATSDTMDIISGYNLLGILYNKREKYDSALYFFRKAIEWLPESPKYKKINSKILDGTATSFLGQRNFTDAQTNLNKAMQLAYQLNDSSLLAVYWQNQGVLYEHMGRSERALEFYTKAGNFYQRNANYNGWVDILINKGVVFLWREDYKQSIRLLLEAKELALKYGFPDNSSSLYNNLGLAYELAGEYKLAEQQFIKGLQYADSLNKPNKIIETGLNLIRIKRFQKKTDEVIRLIKKLEPIVRKQSGIDHLTIFYDQYSWALGDQGRYEEAYQVKLKAGILRDSLNRAVDNAQLLAVEAERIQKEKKILQQETDLLEAKYKQETYQKRTWIIVGFLILSVLISLIIYLNLKRKNARQRLVIAEAESKRLNEKKEIELAVRRQIGDTLHDHLSNKLAIAQITMDSIIQKIPNLSKELEREYENVENLLESYYHDVRDVAHQLMSENLSSYGFAERVNEIVKHLNKSNQVKARFYHTDIPENISTETVEDLLGIINIAIDNTIRHSNASELSIQVFTNDEVLNLTIEDDGKGFNKNTAKDGRGILNMNKRANKLGGKLLIETALDKGTMINLKLPLKT